MGEQRHSSIGSDKRKIHRAADKPVIVQSALPWCEAWSTDGYSPLAGDYAHGSSPDPLAYRFFAGNDPTAFDLGITNTPNSGNGAIRILRSGLYRVTFAVGVKSDAGSSAGYPGYDWYLTLKMEGHGAIHGYVYGGPVVGYVPMTTPKGTYIYRADTPEPWPCPEEEMFLNLVDSSGDFPITIRSLYFHNLTDDDAASGRLTQTYYMKIIRMGNAIEAGYTG